MADVTVGTFNEQPVFLRAKDQLSQAITVWHSEVLIINPERARPVRLQVFTITGFAATHGQNPEESRARALRFGLPLVWIEPMDETRDRHRPGYVQVELLDILSIDRKLYRLVRRSTDARLDSYSLMRL